MPHEITPVAGRHLFRTLSRPDVLLAMRVGDAWNDRAKERGYVDRVGRKGRHKSLLGAAGEVVVARLFGLPYDEEVAKVGFNNVCDVGPFNVRTTNTPRGHLIVGVPGRSRDTGRTTETAHEGPFILVTQPDKRLNEYYAEGWMHTREIRQDKWWRKPSWWVPCSALHAFDELTTEDLQ